MLYGSRVLVTVVWVARDWEVIFCPAVWNGVLADPSVSLKLIKRYSVCALVLQQSLDRIKRMLKKVKIP